MYGDKTQSEMTSGVGPKGQTIPNHSINLEYFVTKDQFQTMLYHEKLTYEEIATRIKYPYSLSAFSRIVRRMGWKTVKGKVSRYGVNESLFDSWTRESAWFYGWIITDGHVNSKSLAVRLQSRDIDVIEKLKRLASFDGEIYEYPGTAEIRIYNRRMVDALHRLGIPQRNKTFDCVFPCDISDSVKWDFMRGAFEGDGSVSVGRDGSLNVSFCGAARNFIDEFQRVLESNGIAVRRSIVKSIFVLSAASYADALRWLLLMYQNTNTDIRMDRKFEKMASFIRAYYEKPRKSPITGAVVEEIRSIIPECA